MAGPTKASPKTKPRQNRSVLPTAPPREENLPRRPPDNLQARRRAEQARHEQKQRQEASKLRKQAAKKAADAVLKPAAGSPRANLMSSIRSAGGKPQKKKK